MNFQQVRQAAGKMDGQYQLKISMFGTPTQIGKVEYNTKTGKPFQQVVIQDDTGETNKVKVLGGKMTQGHIGSRLAFDIAPNPYQPDPSRQVVMYYQGFWNDRAETRQPAPPKKFTGQSPPQQPVKPANNNRDISIERQNALRHADAALQSQLVNDEQGYKWWADMCLEWIQTGRWSSLAEVEAAEGLSESVATAGGSPRTEPDDIPF